MSTSEPDSVSASGPANETTYKPRYIDIGINLADPIFRGQYHGTQRHPDDLSAVVSRAREVGCHKLIITGSDFTSSRHALEIAREYPGTVYTTAGIHPCSSAIFSTTHSHVDTNGHTMPCDADPSKPISEDDEPDIERTTSIIEELRDLINQARSSSSVGPSPLVAFGEFGLDYDRLHYCSKKIQLHSFAAQLDLAVSLKPQLPLFLHSRAAHSDFVSLLKEKFGPQLEKLERGAVVHSFTGTAEEMRELMDLGLYIGTNGCSFKTAENCAVVREIHLDRLMLETDGPWCEVRPSHEGWKHLIEAPKPTDVPQPVASTSTSTEANSAETTGTSTPSESVKRQPKGKQQQQSKKQPKKKEPEVPERFKVVKKEKWVEGAMVKGRNEPCMIERVGKIVAGIKGVSVEEVCEAAWRNTIKVFPVDE
ncbi:Deoxyribonuclease Tat-D [Daldinia childiae]|uniref:Deoxyribonuclease Tat-D n=1 Tax=Daldinia childiae TaxID=326645 RepID=UPI001446D453|nr:Deoxyribonuclease Tat-D [Daldinia childiae]KAF3070801.1 Deoxyribonuclease Tat-D [Daldinia childiae]